LNTFDYSPEAGPAFAEAKRLAEGQGWHDVESRLAHRLCIELALEGRFTEAAAAANEAHRFALRAGDQPWAAQTLTLQDSLCTDQGDLAAAARFSQARLDFAERHRLITHVRQSHTRMAALHLARWQLAPYEECMEGGSVVWGSLLKGWKARAEGRPADALAAVPPPDNTVIPAFWAQYWAERACSLAMLGEAEESEHEFERFWSLFVATPATTGVMVAAVAAAADAAVALGLAEAASRLSSFPLPQSRFSTVPTQSLDRVRGDLALLTGQVADAAVQFSAGLELCTRERLPVEIGRCHLGLAEVATRRGDTDAALRHLDSAAEALSQTGAKFYLDQVIAKKVQLQGITSEDMGSSIVAVNTAVQTEKPDLRRQAAPDGTVTLLFSDIENSTALNERLGDAKWMEVLRQHNALIEREVRSQRGYVVKTMGDGYMVAFKSAADGLRCAMAIQAAARDLAEGVQVRIGLHTGEMTREGDDFFGRHVNLAARVAGHASGGEILVSGVVHELVAGQGFEFGDGGERMMKGFEEPVRIWAVR
jgi:class 3 adenylate cyclase